MSLKKEYFPSATDVLSQDGDLLSDVCPKLVTLVRSLSGSSYSRSKIKFHIFIPQGCLDVETSQRYIAYYNPGFVYQYETNEETPVVRLFNITSIENEWNPDGNETTQQMLSYHGYDTDTHIYEMQFINTALSQNRLEYTITTVYE